jgi:uncharacterized protein (DUF1330 family)
MEGNKEIYVVVEVETIHDQAEFQRYVANYRVAHPRYGGEIVAQSLAPEVVEGDWRPAGIAIQRWPNRESFYAAYEAEDYRPWRELRHRVADTNIALVRAT